MSRRGVIVVMDQSCGRTFWNGNDWSLLQHNALVYPSALKCPGVLPCGNQSLRRKYSGYFDEPAWGRQAKQMAEIIWAPKGVKMPSKEQYLGWDIVAPGLYRRNLQVLENCRTKGTIERGDTTGRWWWIVTQGRETLGAGNALLLRQAIKAADKYM